ncbi:MAG: hypothetical protein UU47_C0002G0061 [candidate division TM6 bacterium GW2011_GWE2_41_16]|nr:MAG: hypothetical protein UU47_C0002G0061 [candidate division TM6 bacterium GW2011_GWE2_41_16]
MKKLLCILFLGCFCKYASAMQLKNPEKFFQPSVKRLSEEPDFHAMSKIKPFVGHSYDQCINVKMLKIKDYILRLEDRIDGSRYAGLIDGQHIACHEWFFDMHTKILKDVSPMGDGGFILECQDQKRLLYELWVVVEDGICRPLGVYTHRPENVVSFDYVVQGGLKGVFVSCVDSSIFCLLKQGSDPQSIVFAQAPGFIKLDQCKIIDLNWSESSDEAWLDVTCFINENKQSTTSFLVSENGIETGSYGF